MIHSCIHPLVCSIVCLPQAKELLDSLGTKYTAVQLDLMGIEGKAMRAELAAVGPDLESESGVDLC